MGLAHFDSKTVESNWAKRSQVGPKGVKLGQKESSWAKRSQVGPKGVKLGQKESSWAWVKLGQAHFDSESNRAKESRWVGTYILQQPYDVLLQYRLAYKSGKNTITASFLPSRHTRK